VRPPSAGNRSGLRSALIYGALALTALLVGAAAYTVALLPAGIVRDRLIEAVKERTGRDLVIAGPASFGFFPSLHVSLPEVSLSAAPGFEGERPFLAARAIDVSVALMPLVRREVRITRLVVRDPVFNLEIDGTGRKSWTFAGTDVGLHRIRLAQADAGGPETTATDAPSGMSGGEAQGEQPSARRPSGTAALGDLILDDVRIANGTLHYRDARSGRGQSIEKINVETSLPAFAEALTTKGTAVWSGRTVTLDGTLSSPAEIAAHQPAKLSLALAAEGMRTTFEGTLSLSEGFLAEGILASRSDSLRAILHWAGVEPPPSEGFGAMTAKGLLRASPDRVSLSTAEIMLDRTAVHGDLGLDLNVPRPHLTASLKLSELDLATYRSAGGAPPAAGVSDTGPAAPAGSAARSIEDIIERTEGAAPAGPRVKGYAHREGWSDAPYDLAKLSALDADAKLSIGRLGLRTISLGQSDVTIALRNGVMETTLDDVRLYNGKAHGTVTLDGTAAGTATLNANVTLDGVSAEHLLHDAAGFDHLAGNGRLALVMWGRGANEREIVESLNGRIEFSVSDGAVIGIDIPALAEKLSHGNLGGLSLAPTDRTPFSELTSTWTVKQGIAENHDLKVTSDLVHVAGAGRIAVPAREIDYTLRPRLASASAAAAGFEVPVHMIGPWDDPKFSADFAGALKDEKAKAALKDIKKQLKGKKTDEIVNDLLTKGDSETADGEGLKAKGKKLLNQFLNKD